MNKGVKIKHLHHSSVTVETDKHFLIFDYFNNNIEGSTTKSIKDGILSESDIPSDKKILVFASHSHRDHFDPVIFQWEKYLSNIQYILGNDIEILNYKKNYHQVNPYESLKLYDITINTYGSTDRGVSFLIYIDDFIIFHAGDLNWWHWKEFSEEQLLKEEIDFKTEINKLVGTSIDIAFVPVDPRLDEFYYLAGEYFLNVINPKLFVPIHFADNFSITNKFAEKVKSIHKKVAVIEGHGQEIEFPTLG
ncbi:MBL fold metallo-hydrolase [Alkaliphilus pronyensis]|uniref:MBL fold metallo-hydrolase n=1 Tax=Alkaliphilus pronyensis TaxID=1482732 RepID=A0A6I0EZV1_9FIRM|nr:MBL fold metallo-hydrolase [Alkaliphilus pronyensis]KAB3532912.1 MBL fold metallo-hydrolase [Alkaliphilus pronyensis]